MNIPRRKAIEKGAFDASGYLQLSSAGEYPDRHGPTVEAPTTVGWEIIGAVLGRGTLLVGESPRDPKGEALVLAPPGAHIATAPNEDPPAPGNVWRVALWDGDEAGNRHVDLGQPLWVSVVSLAYVIALVELMCPDNLSWVADQLERQLLNARIAQTPDIDGVVHPHAVTWSRDAEELLDDLDVVLSPDRQEPGAEAGDRAEDWLPDLSSAISQPGRYERRLAPGWLRARYLDLGQDLVHLLDSDEKR